MTLEIERQRERMRAQLPRIPTITPAQKRKIADKIRQQDCQNFAHLTSLMEEHEQRALSEEDSKVFRAAVSEKTTQRDQFRVREEYRTVKEEYDRLLQELKSESHASAIRFFTPIFKARYWERAQQKGMYVEKVDRDKYYLNLGLSIGTIKKINRLLALRYKLRELEQIL